MTLTLLLDKNKDDFSNFQPFCNHEVGKAEDKVLKSNTNIGRRSEPRSCLVFL